MTEECFGMENLPVIQEAVRNDVVAEMELTLSKSMKGKSRNRRKGYGN